MPIRVRLSRFRATCYTDANRKLDFVAKHWGDLASLLGLALTIWFAWRAKTASEQARDAARDAVARVMTLDTVADLSAALTIMEEVLRLQRLGAWDIILDRCATLQLHLARSGQAPDVSEACRGSIKTAAGQFVIIMDEIETFRTDQQKREFDSVRFNRTVVTEMTSVEIARTSLRKAGA